MFRCITSVVHVCFCARRILFIFSFLASTAELLAPLALAADRARELDGLVLVLVRLTILDGATDRPVLLVDLAAVASFLDHCAGTRRVDRKSSVSGKGGYALVHARTRPRKDDRA